MTIEEKRKGLHEYCKCRRCSQCDVGGHVKHHSCNFADDFCYESIVSDSDVEFFYSLVFGSDNDNVDHPKHYQGKNECIDVMVAMFGVEAVKSFCRCNAYKYRFRADKKNGDEDIRKAEWYETKLIELEVAEHDKD